MAVNELIKHYRDELKYLRRKLRERIAICHVDALEELLWVLQQDASQCIIVYLEEDLVRVTYWV